jgi:hypothetical protein
MTPKREARAPKCRATRWTARMRGSQHDIHLAHPSESGSASAMIDRSIPGWTGLLVEPSTSETPRRPAPNALGGSKNVRLSIGFCDGTRNPRIPRREPDRTAGKPRKGGPKDSDSCGHGPRDARGCRGCADQQSSGQCRRRGLMTSTMAGGAPRGGATRRAHRFGLGRHWGRRSTHRSLARAQNRSRAPTACAVGDRDGYCRPIFRPWPASWRPSWRSRCAWRRCACASAPPSWPPGCGAIR